MSNYQEDVNEYENPYAYGIWDSYGCLCEFASTWDKAVDRAASLTAFYGEPHTANSYWAGP